MVIIKTSSPALKFAAFAIPIELLPDTPIEPETADNVPSVFTEVLLFTFKAPNAPVPKFEPPANALIVDVVPLQKYPLLIGLNITLHGGVWALLKVTINDSKVISIFFISDANVPFFK